MNNVKKKITIIGSGYVGSTIAYAMVLCDIVDEIALIDRNFDKAESEINDIRHGFPFVGDTVLRNGSYEDCEDSDIIILAIGRNRKSNESRLDLANDNIIISKEYVDKIKPYYRDNILIVVTNPIDIITQKVTEWLGTKYGRVFGTGCILDSSRFIREIADYLCIDIKDVRGMVIGEHGDSQVHLWSQVRIKGYQLKEYCNNNNVKWNDNIILEIDKKVVNMGAKIIAGKGRTQFGIATCAVDLVNAIIKDKRILVPVSSEMQGEYGIKNVSLSYPSVIGANGILERKKVELDKNELDCFVKSANNLIERISQL